MFRGVYRWFKMRKGVKECAQRATILAVWAVETLHCLPLPYIYVGVWAQVFWHLSLTPLVLSAYALKACSINSPQRFICCS